MPLFSSTTITPDKTVPNRSSSFGQWLEWYKTLESRYGTKAANQIFSYVWDKRKPTDWTKLADFANRHELIDYLSKNGLKLDQNGIDLTAGFAYSIIDNISDTLKIGKYALYIVGGLILVILVSITFSIAKNPNSAIGAAAQGVKYI